MPYKLSTAFDAAQKTRAVEMLAQGARENWTARGLYANMAAAGLSYARGAMQEDQIRASVISAAKTDDAFRRADSFYDRIYKPFKDEHKYTRAQMGDVMSGFKRQIEVPEDLEEGVYEWGEWTEDMGT